MRGSLAKRGQAGRALPGTATPDAGAAPAKIDPAKFEETPAHHKRRAAYVGRTRETIRNQVLANEKGVTDAERKVIKNHWAHAFRLIRIWNIAEGLGDVGTAKAASTALINADNSLIGNLKKLNAKAPKRAKKSAAAPAKGKSDPKGGK